MKERVGKLDCAAHVVEEVGRYRICMTLDYIL